MNLLCLVLGFWLQSPGAAAYDRANEYFSRREFPAALSALDEALRQDPRLVAALTLKAKIAMAENRFDVARGSLEQALAADPKSGYAQFLYGLEAWLRNDLSAALPRLRKARQLNPKDARTALYLGLTEESLGETAQALQFYTEAIRLEKSAGTRDAATLLPPARLLMLLDRDAEAEVMLREAIQLAPQLRDPHFEMARLLLHKGESKAAAGEGELALTLGDGTATDEQLHYLLIRAWQQCGMPEQAARHAAILRAMETPGKR